MTDGLLGDYVRNRPSPDMGVSPRIRLKDTLRPPGLRPSLVPQYRVIVGVDVEKSTFRTNVQKARLRDSLYNLASASLKGSGITEEDHDRLVDRGDGLLIPVRPSDRLPRTLVLSRFVSMLNRLLAEHNVRYPEHAFRLRVTIHAGEVHDDRRGRFGEAVDLTCRLLDSLELKSALENAAAPVVLAVSDDIYHSLVRQGYDGIDPDDFQPLIHVQLGEYRHSGWVVVDHPPITGG